MIRKISALALAAIALLPASLLTAQQNFSWNGTLSTGQTLEVMNINGGIDVKPAAGNQVSVSAVKRSKNNTEGDVEVKVENESAGIVVCVLYRRQDGSFPSGCRERNKGRSKRGVDVNVDFTVRMPAAANLVANSVNGGVNIAGLRGDVEAKTVNGGVNVETTGHAQASTVNGGVYAKVGKLDQNTKFSTVNGRILVAVGSALNADVSMSTVNGSLETAFPITVQGKMGKRNLQGRIGTGGPKLELSTVNGGIRIEKAS
ncbi:MAG: DUF4097 family beta strand repeat-containing protein [Bryobacterales bacterium]|nr:DUF4097 family beta strand repeat-containing protein [Bryobacterales bacterium]